MTKKRNHTIPRFLLNYFASRSEKDKYWVWQHSANGEPVEISTKDASVSKYFYGDPKNEIEEKLSEFEGEASSALRVILEKSSTKGYEPILRKFTFTLITRTRAFREQTIETVRKGWAEQALKMSPEIIDKAIKKTINESFGEHIDEATKTLPPIYRFIGFFIKYIPKLRRWAKEKLLESLDPREAYEYMSGAVIYSLRSQLIDKMMTESHVKTFGKIIDDANITDRFNPIKWQLLTVKHPVVILGDIGVIVRSDNGDYGAFHRFGGNWSEVFLPLSPNHILVGCNHENNFHLSFEEINQMSASYSLATIYSSENSDYVQTLATSISSKDPLLTDNEISEVIDSVWEELT